MADATKGPGFTIDGNEVVLFNGLRAMPLWENGAPYPTSIDRWLGRTSHRDLRERLEEKGGSERVSIPELEGYLLAGDPQGVLYLLVLKKTSKEFGYSVSVLPLDPNLQLIASHKKADKFGLSAETSITLLDCDAFAEGGAFDLTRGLAVTVTRKTWGQSKEAILVVDFVRGEVCLGVSEAETFLITEIGDDWTDGAKLVAALHMAQADESKIGGHQSFREDGAIIHSFKNMKEGRRFAFAVKMPTGMPIAGVFEIEKLLENWKLLKCTLVSFRPLQHGRFLVRK